MFYTNVKPIKLLRLPSTALLLSVIKDVIPPPKVIIYMIHSVLVPRSENTVWSNGLKEYAKMCIHIWPIKALLKASYPSLQNVSHSTLQYTLSVPVDSTIMQIHCDTTNNYGIFWSFGPGARRALRQKWSLSLFISRDGLTGFGN